MHLLCEIAAHFSYIAACAHGMNYYKAWAFCSTFSSIAKLRCVCEHPPGSHQVIAGAKLQGRYLSSLTAEYPPSLAAALATRVAPFTTSLGHHEVSIAQFANLLPEPFVHRRPAVCDGAGVNSTAEHSNARHSPVTPLAHKLLAYLREHSLCEAMICHVAQGQPSHPIAFQSVQIAHEHLHPGCTNSQCTHVSPGQPFCLQLIGML